MYKIYQNRWTIKIQAIEKWRVFIRHNKMQQIWTV